MKNFLREIVQISFVKFPNQSSKIRFDILFLNKSLIYKETYLSKDRNVSIHQDEVVEDSRIRYYFESIEDILERRSIYKSSFWRILSRFVRNNFIRSN